MLVLQLTGYVTLIKPGLLLRNTEFAPLCDENDSGIDVLDLRDLEYGFFTGVMRCRHWIEVEAPIGLSWPCAGVGKPCAEGGERGREGGRHRERGGVGERPASSFNTILERVSYKIWSGS